MIRSVSRSNICSCKCWFFKKNRSNSEMKESFFKITIEMPSLEIPIGFIFFEVKRGGIKKKLRGKR